MSRDYRDIVGGLLLVIGGAAFSWYAAEYYSLGTLRRMGPGMFPMALGAVLALFGLAIAVPALFRQGTVPEIRIWTPLFVLSGVAAFAMTIRPFGLFPAIVAVIVISSFAELKVRPLSLAILCICLCLVTWLTFRVGLGLPIAVVRWPF